MIAFLFTLFVFSSCEGEREREREEERDARKFQDATLNSFLRGKNFRKKEKSHAENYIKFNACARSIG